MATETVVSPLLSDKPAAPKPKPRPVSKDYADTEDAGYIESVEEFGARLTVPQLVALAVLTAIASIRLLLWGRRTWRTA
ncbi:hypothetical protein ABT264_35050 [Streptomyces virginiae]|uniref:hypothetical protein n=1 Tax=Streptomyces virginiae TaxID=1961 RepID=UPI003323E88A